MKGLILFPLILTISLLGLSGASAFVQPTSHQNSTLSIEIYARDDKGQRPASKTKFYLLDAELETILRQAGLKEIHPWELVDSYAMAVMTSRTSKGVYQEKYKDFHMAAEAALKPHVIQTVITDAKGKAQFRSLTPSTYYLLGIPKISNGISVIRSPVEVNAGDNVFTF